MARARARTTFLTAALALWLASPALAQTGDKNHPDDAESEPNDKIELDLSFDYDPEELREHIRDKIRFKRIWRSFGLAGYHVFPAYDSGPYEGPPLQIWSNGFATSLWRDPITGWPLQ